MSCATTITLPVDWAVISPAFRPTQTVNLELGNAFNDVWSLQLYKKPLKKGNCTIKLSLERQKGENRVMAIIKLKFTDLNSNKFFLVKYFRTFRNADQQKASFHVNQQKCQIITESDKFQVTGGILLNLIQRPEPIASPQTLTTLSTDFKKMCCSNTFSDIILRCGSEVFTAHKVILAARCPVFDELIRNNVNDDIKIDIKDLEPHVLKAILLFIYSGETEELTFQSACDLLRAAESYRLNELKTICVNHITSSFSVDNVIDYLDKCEVAKTYALEFITENIPEIERTKQWQNFKKKFSNLVPTVWQENVHVSEIEGPEHCKDIKQECPEL